MTSDWTMKGGCTIPFNREWNMTVEGIQSNAERVALDSQEVQELFARALKLPVREYVGFARIILRYLDEWDEGLMPRV
jgi:hypothetical protein